MRPNICLSGCWDVCISSRSSWIPLPVSPPFCIPAAHRKWGSSRWKFMSSIKASVMIYFAKNSSNDYPGIDPHSNFIRQLSSYGTRSSSSTSYGSRKWEAWQPGAWAWKNNILVTKALKGSSIAALSLDDSTTPLHLFYQDPEFHVRDLFNRGGGSEWYHGEQILAESLSMNESIALQVS